MKKILLASALLTSVALSPAMAEGTANIETNVMDSVKVKANVAVQEKTADVQKDAKKVVITETVKTTAGRVGIEDQDEATEKSVDKGVDLYDEHKDADAKVKETVEKSVSVDTETGDLTVEETATSTIKGKMSTEGLTENGQLTKEGALQVESVVSEIEADVDTEIEAITPAAGTKDSNLVEESIDSGARVKTTETLEMTPPETTSVAVEEETGFFGTIKSWFN